MTYILALLTVLVSASATFAQEGVALKETKISGWFVSKFQTPNDGLSCQAYKCNGSPCNVDNADAVVRLWGSARRKAVTPMIGMKVTRTGANSASLVVADNSFALDQAENSRGKLFIAKRAQDDATIVRLMAQNPATTITFVSDKGRASFRLNGVNRVFAFFEKECGIPLP